MSPISCQSGDEEPSASASLHFELHPTSGVKVDISATGPRAFALVSLVACLIGAVVTVVYSQSLGTDMTMALACAQVLAGVLAVVLFVRPNKGKQENLTGPEGAQPVLRHSSSNEVPGFDSVQRPTIDQVREPKKDAKHRRESYPGQTRQRSSRRSKSPPLS